MTSLSDLFNSIGTESPRTIDQPRSGYALLRVSTDSQDEQSQRRDIEQACQMHNMVVTRWHSEREKANERRLEFERFIDDAIADPECAFVIARDSSRIARNAGRIDEISNRLRTAGVRLITDCRYIRFDDDLSVGGIWLGGVLRLQPEAYSAQCRDWTMKSMAHVCQQRDPETGWSYHLGGIPLFGYRRSKVVTDQRDRRGNTIEREIWLLDDTPVKCDGTDVQKWESARLMWLDWYCKEGLGEDRIAQRLTQLGIRGARGKAFSTSTVHYLRTPEALLTYCGCYLWNKTAKKELGKQIKSYKKPPSEWQIAEQAHPPILTMDEAQKILDCAQSRSRKHNHLAKAHSSRPARVYALTGGLAQCGYCHSNVVGYSSKESNGETYGYYCCGSWKYRSGADCGPRFTVRRGVEDEIIRAASQFFPVTPSQADSFAKRVNGIMWEQGGCSDVQRRQIQRKIEEIDTKLEHIVKAVMEGSVLASRLEEQARTLEAEKRRLTRELEMLTTKPVPQITATEVCDFYQSIEGALNSATAERKREIIRSVCESVFFDPEKRRVEVNLNYCQAFSQTLAPPRGVEPRLPS